MENTYTYIARSAKNPRRVATFTLHGNRMSVGMGVPFEQMESLLPGGQEDSAEDTGTLESHAPWIQPLVVALLERRSEPFHISDVEVRHTNGGLHVHAWSRLAGLRLIPVMFRWSEVDNPAAAADFLREVEERKEQASTVRKFVGFLDYWVSWAAGLAALLLVVGRQRRSRA